LAVATGNFVHNLLRSEGEPSYFERTVVSDDLLTERGRDQFLAMAAERGEELTTDLDTFLTGLVPAERATAGKKYGVGIYLFEEKTLGNPEGLARTAGADDLLDDRKTNATGEVDVLNIVRQK
jgi:hypothetical protein